METLFQIDTDRKTPKYVQVINSINDAIRHGKLKKGDQIFSINELCDEFLLCRDTVQKAYNILRRKGILVAVRGKGFYINRTDVTTPYKILLLFNKISDYKRQIYNAFVRTMGSRASIDLKIHHFNAGIFDGFVTDSLREYDYYVVMPHFYDQAELIPDIIKKIPSEKLVILDKDLYGAYPKYAAVFQDFKNDIHEALETGLDLLRKYDRLVLVQPRLIPYPPEIAAGFRNFCLNYRFEYRILPEIDPRTPVNRGEAYILVEEADLVSLIKICRAKNYTAGKDVGIISYNDTPLKEILLNGITVLSTDHDKMGETAARLILENRQEKVRNPFTLIRRNSL